MYFSLHNKPEPYERNMPSLKQKSIINVVKLCFFALIYLSPKITFTAFSDDSPVSK